MTIPSASPARRYAQALYAVGKAHGVEERLAEDLDLLRSLWEGDPTTAEPLLTHPLLPTETKEAVLERALEGQVHPLTLNLVRLLVRRRRATLLPELQAAFLREREEQEEALYVEVRTAYPLVPEAREALRERLAALLNRPVGVTEVAAPELLAGVELRVQGRRLDASLRGRLRALGHELEGVDDEPA